MTFIAPWKKNRRRNYEDETELQGDQILSAMMSDHPPAATVPLGHEEKAKQSLESIYTLETIDIQTVKPLLKKSPIKPKAPSKPSDPQLTLLPCRLSDPFDQAVIPWIERRGGIATRYEIEERLERVKCCCDSFSNTLIEIEDHLFAVDAESKERFHAVISRAKTYFYQPHIHYSMSTLVHWLVCEFAQEWIAISPAFIEKCLSVSKHFTRFKTKEHQLFIKNIYNFLPKL